MGTPHRPSEVFRVTSQGALAAYMRQMEAGGQGEPLPQPQPPVRKFHEGIVRVFGSDRQCEDIDRNNWKVR